MINETYRTKEVVEEYEVKTIIVVSPQGNQYHVNKENVSEFLRVRGIAHKKDAVKQGWLFK